MSSIAKGRSAKSWSEMNGAEMFAAIMSSSALRQERKRSYALSLKIADGRARVIPQRKTPARSRQIWHISPIMDGNLAGYRNAALAAAAPATASDVSYCMHPVTGQPLVVDGFCLVYDADLHNFRSFSYRNAVGSDWAKQPYIEDGEVHMACDDGGSLVAVYKKGKCVSACYSSKKVAVTLEAFINSLDLSGANTGKGSGNMSGKTAKG